MIPAFIGFCLVSSLSNSQLCSSNPRHSTQLKDKKQLGWKTESVLPKAILRCKVVLRGQYPNRIQGISLCISARRDVWMLNFLPAPLSAFVTQALDRAKVGTTVQSVVMIARHDLNKTILVLNRRTLLLPRRIGELFSHLHLMHMHS